MENFVSYNNTSVKLDNNQIFKKYVIKSIPKIYYKIINKNITLYHKKLFSLCNGIPRLISNKKKLEFSFEYCGESLNKVLRKKISLNKMEIILNGVILILNDCEKKKIDIDPHFKNFTIMNDKIYYVDMFPPLTKQYINLLIKYNKNIKYKIKSHLKTWSYKILKQHFIADLKKSKFINRKFYFYTKKYFLKKKTIPCVNYKLINKIIYVEEKNLKDKKFTLS